MTKQLIILASTITMISMSGCTQQVASPNPGGVDANGATMVASDTVVLDGSNGTSGANGSNGVSGTNGSNGNGANSVYFAYDSNKVNQDGKSKIASDTTALKSKSTSGKIKIEGNSDEFGTDEYNYALGLKRAKAVKDSMVARGDPADKVKVVSYGESNPVCEDGTQECYQKNRRADYQ